MRAATIRRSFAANCGLFAHLLTQDASRFTQSSMALEGRRRGPTAMPDAVGRRTRRSTGAVTLGGRPGGSAPVRMKLRTPGTSAERVADKSVDRARRGRRATVTGGSLFSKTPCRAGTDDRRGAPKPPAEKVGRDGPNVSAERVGRDGETKSKRPRERPRGPCAHRSKPLPSASPKSPLQGPGRLSRPTREDCLGRPEKRPRRQRNRSQRTPRAEAA
jgi:hypothetical protein